MSRCTYNFCLGNFEFTEDWMPETCDVIVNSLAFVIPCTISQAIEYEQQWSGLPAEFNDLCYCTDCYNSGNYPIKQNILFHDEFDYRKFMDCVTEHNHFGEIRMITEEDKQKYGLL